MSSDLQQIRVGLTSNHPCSYLQDRLERVAVAMEAEMQTADNFELLLANGFRRSGDIIYKPHCDHCQACQALRVSIAQFAPSRSQKRLLKQVASQLTWQLKTTMDDNWFELYSRYIEVRHRHGSMYPPRHDEFAKFATASWLDTQYLHLYLDQQLVAIAITDILPNSASAFYTFFNPDSSLSLGTLAILIQLQLAKSINKQWLYLGYHIEQCPAMNYKVRFSGHQKLVKQRWQG